jgi:hypothetical protein
MLDSNFGLVTLAGLNNVTNIGGIYIENNNQLVNLSALSNVSSGLQYLVLQNNHSLLTLSGHQEIQLDLISLPAGVYLVRVLTGEEMGVAKVVVR